MTRTLIIFAIGLMILTNLYTLKQNKELRQTNSTLKSESTSQDSLLIKTHERALKYQLVAMELNEIVDKFQSSRNEKLKNKELINKMSEL